MHRFDYKAYRRPLAGGFANAREAFSRREGVLLRLEDRDGRVGFGEAAPLPSFGTESFASCLGAAAGVGERLELELAQTELRGYPCLSWALESALAMIESEGRWPSLEKAWPVCGLLSDLSSEREIEERVALSYRCLKAKIGKGSMEAELKALDRAIDRTEGRIRFRLDANGSLTRRQAAMWLERLAERPIEFLEQPLERGAEREMIRLAEDYPTPIALDESTRSVDDLKRWRDQQWPGLFVLKPSLCGSRSLLAEELRQSSSACVFSSALETKVGAANAIGFAMAFGDRSRALGFGVERLFADANVGLELGPFLQSDGLPALDELERLWSQI